MRRSERVGSQRDARSILKGNILSDYTDKYNALEQAKQDAEKMVKAMEEIVANLSKDCWKKATLGPRDVVMLYGFPTFYIDGANWPSAQQLEGRLAAYHKALREAEAAYGALSPEEQRASMRPAP